MSPKHDALLGLIGRCQCIRCMPDEPEETATVIFCGHVEKTELACGSMVRAYVVTPMDPAGQTFQLRVPESDAGNWLPGTVVYFTISTKAPA